MENNKKNTGVVFILVNPFGEVLLQLRDSKDKKYPNQWCFPGGRKDQEDNNYIDTVIREANEEFSANLKAGDCELIDVYSIKDFVEDNHVYVCKIDEPEKLKMNEGADMKWMTINEIDKLNLGFKQEIIIPKLKTFIKNKNSLKDIKYEDYLEGTNKILQESRKEKKPYLTTIMDKEFIIFPNVFSPKYFKDTELFAKNLPIKTGAEVLEIGSGTGVVSIFCAFKGAKKVLAVDINPDAVANTKENVKKHKLENIVEIRQGNLYEPLKKDEKFDVIFWNTPFGLIENKNISDLEKSVYDPNYKSTEQFIKEAPKHLKKGGKLFIGFSSTLGKLDLIKKFAKEANFNLKLIFEAVSEETHSVKFEIFEATPG